MDIYAKVARNIKQLPTEIQIEDPGEAEKLALALELAQIAAQHGITIYTCNEDLAAVGPIQRGACVDKDILDQLWPHKARRMKITIGTSVAA